MKEEYHRIFVSEKPFLIIKVKKVALFLVSIILQYAHRIFHEPNHAYAKKKFVSQKLFGSPKVNFVKKRCASMYVLLLYHIVLL